MDIWVAIASVFLSIATSLILVSFKVGKMAAENEAIKKELDDTKSNVKSTVRAVKKEVLTELESFEELTNLKIEFAQLNQKEVKNTLTEVKTTVLRLGNELSRLLGQLEGDSHNGKDSTSER